MLELHEEVDGKILVAKISGELSKEDLQLFLPAAERLIKSHGKIRVLCQMHDFQGWEFGAMWEDVKFELKHFSDIERLALVGHHKWHAGMATLCRPFTKAKVRYFDMRDSRLAEEWIWASLPTSSMTQSERSTFTMRHNAIQEGSEKSISASEAAEYWSSAT